METKRAKADSIAGALEAAESRSVEVATERAAEHELVGSREIRPAADALERRGSLARERHTANSTRLGCRLRPAADRTGDRQDLASELDVAPTKGEQLSLTQVGVGGDADDLGVVTILSSPGPPAVWIGATVEPRGERAR